MHCKKFISHPDSMPCILPTTPAPQLGQPKTSLGSAARTLGRQNSPWLKLRVRPPTGAPLGMLVCLFLHKKGFS